MKHEIKCFYATNKLFFLSFFTINVKQYKYATKHQSFLFFYIFMPSSFIREREKSDKTCNRNTIKRRNISESGKNKTKTSSLRVNIKNIKKSLISTSQLFSFINEGKKWVRNTCNTKFILLFYIEGYINYFFPIQPVIFIFPQYLLLYLQFFFFCFYFPLSSVWVSSFL